MTDFEEALKELARLFNEVAESLQEIAEHAMKEAEKLPVERERIIPPRRTVSRARSPFLRRYWINHRARDKLAHTSLK